MSALVTIAGRAALVGLLLGIDASAAAAPNAAEEVARIRAEIESMLSNARRDMERAPDVGKEADAERAKAEALKKEIDAAKRDADEAEAALAKAKEELAAAARAHVDAKARGAVLSGFRKAAFERLLADKAAPLSSAVDGALAEPATLQSTLARVGEGPAKAAEESLRAILVAWRGGEPQIRRIEARVTAEARGDEEEGPAKLTSAARLDRLTETAAAAAACLGHDGPLSRGRERRPARLATIRAALRRAREAIEGASRELVASLREKARTESAGLRAALPPELVAEAFGRLEALAIERLRARIAPVVAGALFDAPTRANPEAKAPKAEKALLRAVGKKMDSTCAPLGAP